MSILPVSIVDWINSYMPAVAILCGLTWPIFRTCKRYLQRIKPYHKRCSFALDFMNGTAFPFLCLMIISPLSNAIVIDGIIISLAGVYGCQAIVRDILNE